MSKKGNEEKRLSRSPSGRDMTEVNMVRTHLSESSCSPQAVVQPIKGDLSFNKECTANVPAATLRIGEAREAACESKVFSFTWR